MHILNTLCMFKYINEKPDFTCTYYVDLHMIYRTDHTVYMLYMLYIIDILYYAR